MSPKINTAVILKFAFNTFLKPASISDKDCSCLCKHQLNDDVISVNNLTADSISISSFAFKHICTVISSVSFLHSSTSAFTFKCTHIITNSVSLYSLNVASAVS
jgi:hypothetical protein